MTDHRMKFRTLVALNALGIAHRELTGEPSPDDAEELLRQVRSAAPTRRCSPS